MGWKNFLFRRGGTDVKTLLWIGISVLLGCGYEPRGETMGMAQAVPDELVSPLADEAENYFAATYQFRSSWAHRATVATRPQADIETICGENAGACILEFSILVSDEASFGVGVLHEMCHLGSRLFFETWDFEHQTVAECYRWAAD